MNFFVRQRGQIPCMTLDRKKFGILLIWLVQLAVGEESGAAFAKLHIGNSGDNTFLRHSAQVILVRTHIPAARPERIA